MTSEKTQRPLGGQASRRLFLGGTSAAAAGVSALVGGANPAFAAAAASSSSTRSSGAGPVSGPVRNDTCLLSGTVAQLSDVTAYLGIPYAASTSWPGVRKGDAFGDIPSQSAW